MDLISSVTGKSFHIVLSWPFSHSGLWHNSSRSQASMTKALKKNWSWKQLAWRNIKHIHDQQCCIKSKHHLFWLQFHICLLPSSHCASEIPLWITKCLVCSTNTVSFIICHLVVETWKSPCCCHIKEQNRTVFQDLRKDFIFSVKKIHETGLLKSK